MDLDTLHQIAMWIITIAMIPLSIVACVMAFALLVWIFLAIFKPSALEDSAPVSSNASKMPVELEVGYLDKLLAAGYGTDRMSALNQALDAALFEKGQESRRRLSSMVLVEIPSISLDKVLEAGYGPDRFSALGGAIDAALAIKEETNVDSQTVAAADAAERSAEFVDATEPA
ncbi:hypothetical protein [Burkholderia pseudomallei]|uniref:hypothetical protein n=1 Tax=Burkholderia pseudomallei TaxID=28450 RepID=UPI000F088394|nr:hypothetical protein [Burkholderia pseudomallei]CAJ3076177.1 Uncharacterised protein [Burkholderia pseudomallei]VCK72560.1 Uncharacterised protein [Burkholderia pseudomallei]VCK79881.1 Uncharacterised protein [Burkholderia pseudomallei]VCK80121.1 Uncharacterised protein [Burkholderia pseudomallei]VCK80679.1 Uncharacterised protein [Burkholderia pseudomallei]